MRYSMTISEDIIENGPEWQGGLEPLLEDAVDTFCSTVVSKVSATIIKRIPAPYSLDYTLQQRILYGLQYADDYCDWAEERVKALLTQAEANIEHRSDTYHTVRVSWTFEVSLAGVELAMSDLENFFVTKRQIPYPADCGVSFWEWRGVYGIDLLSNDPLANTALAARHAAPANSDQIGQTTGYLEIQRYGVDETLYPFGKVIAWHAKEEAVRLYPDLSDEEEPEEWRCDEGVQPVLEAALSTCLWISYDPNNSFLAFQRISAAYKEEIRREWHSTRQIEFKNGSMIRFTSAPVLSAYRGARFDYLVVDNADLDEQAMKQLTARATIDGSVIIKLGEEEPAKPEEFVPNGWITLNGVDEIPVHVDYITSNCTVAPGWDTKALLGLTSWDITINEAMKVEAEDIAKVFDIAPQLLGSNSAVVLPTPPPFPGPSKSTVAPDKEETTKTEPLTNARELRTLFGWLREDKACAYGGYEVIPTDLGTYHILLWGHMDYCALDIDDLKAYAKKIEDEAWKDERQNPFPIDDETWVETNGK